MSRTRISSEEVENRYLYDNAQDFPFIPSRNGGKDVAIDGHRKAKNLISALCQNEERKRFDTEKEKCGNTTKTQMSWKRRCVIAVKA